MRRAFILTAVAVSLVYCSSPDPEVELGRWAPCPGPPLLTDAELRTARPLGDEKLFFRMLSPQGPAARELREVAVASVAGRVQVTSTRRFPEGDRSGSRELDRSQGARIRELLRHALYSSETRSYRDLFPRSDEVALHSTMYELSFFESEYDRLCAWTYAQILGSRLQPVVDLAVVLDSFARGELPAAEVSAAIEEAERKLGVLPARKREVAGWEGEHLRPQWRRDSCEQGDRMSVDLGDGWIA